MTSRPGEGRPGGARGGHPSRVARLAFALAMASVWSAYVWTYYRSPRLIGSDFDHLWNAARVLWSGGDPYAATGPGRPNEWPWPLFYPAPALVLIGPLAALPLSAARAVFVGGSAGVLAWVVTRDGWARVPLFASYAFLHAVIRAQWSPLITAAFLWPALGWVLVAKPTLGGAVWLARPTRVAVLGGLAVGVVATALRPDWPAGWLDAVSAASHFRPVVATVGGPVVLLALLRWRRPEARLLLAMACMPVTLVWYETLPLFAVPRSAVQSVVLALLSCATAAAAVTLLPDPPRDAVGLLEAYVRIAGPIFLVLLYLPCLAMVLQRPNEGAVPEWLERVLARARVPGWLAGRPASAPTD